MNGTIQYTIRPYDTLWMLSQIFNTSVDSIMNMNPGIDPRSLRVGQIITIQPGPQYYSRQMYENQFNNTVPGNIGTDRRENGAGNQNNVGNNVGNGTRTNVGNNMGNGTGTNTGNNIGNGTRTNTGNNIGNGTGNNVGNNMGNGAGTNAGNNMGNGTGTNTGNNVGNSTGNNIRNNIRNNAGNNTANGMVPDAMRNGRQGRDSSWNGIADDLMEGGINSLDPEWVRDIVSYLCVLSGQHVNWLKAAITSIIFDLPDRESTISRLFQSPEDFREVYEEYYNEEVAYAISNLIIEYLTYVIELVQARMEGNTEAEAEAQRNWDNSIDHMAHFMIRQNPDWREEDWNALLDEHMQLTRRYIMSVLRGDYEEGIREFDNIEASAMEMGQLVAEGIIRHLLLSEENAGESNTQ